MKKIYGTIKLIIFLVILISCLNICMNLTKRKECYNKYTEYYSQKEEFDVLFFGTSHVVNSIDPMKLYNDYGIISYNMANHAEEMEITYYDILLTLKKRNPKLVVLDAFGIYETEFSKSAMMHRFLDAYPLSYEKLQIIKEYSTQEELLDNMFEYLFNFSFYHSRWNELTKNDFGTNKNKVKGAEFLKAVNKRNKINGFNDIEVKRKDTKNIEYFRKILEYCNDNNIKILVTLEPFAASKEMIGVSKYVDEICKEYHINYINFLNMDNVVNYNIDFADEWSHLNPSGGRKITEYIGKYIIQNYDVPDQRKNAVYDFWRDDYSEYVEYKIKQMESVKEYLNSYIMLLYDEKDIKYEIKISSNLKIEKVSLLQELLENLNNNYEIDDKAFQDNKDKTIKITTYDNRDGHLIKTIWF